MKHIQDLKISLARFILVCTLLVLISLANAQNSDPLLLNYGLAFENLNEAVTSIGVDSQQSIEDIDHREEWHGSRHQRSCYTRSPMRP